MASYVGSFDGSMSIQAAAAVPYDLLVDRADTLYAISRATQKQGNDSRPDVALLNALIGAAAGGAASATYKRAEAEQTLTDFMALGGARTIETRTMLSRVTTAADVTELKSFLARKQAPASYPADLSGNGGGNKVGGL